MSKDPTLQEISKISEEIEKRLQHRKYRDSFSLFAEENIKILTKDSSVGFVPFTLNTCQQIIDRKLNEQLESTGKVRAIILKARQQGISTYCTGRVFWKSYFNPLSKSVVMAHDSPTSDNLFQMSKDIIDHMDPKIKPQLFKSNSKEITINSPAMNDKDTSSYRLYTAGAKESGRGTTPTIAHLSEVAFWPYDEEILAGLFQGVSRAEGTEIILESTANGVNGEFYRLWKDAENGKGEYMPIFLPWFMTEEYQEELPDAFITKKVKGRVEKKIPTYSEDELALKEKHSLTDKQLYWRRIKIAEIGEFKFKQEYPSSSHEAFITSGYPVFNTEIIGNMAIKPAQKTMDWDNDYNGFIDKPLGSYELFSYPRSKERRFVIGADPALGTGRDYSAAVIMDLDYNIYGVFRDNRIGSFDFAKVLGKIAAYFNNAFIVCERNGIGTGVLSYLKTELNYINLYREQKYHSVQREEKDILGFQTTQRTKEMIIGNLKSIVEDPHKDFNIPSSWIIQEMKDFITTISGKTEASPGSHDDLVVALALACEGVKNYKPYLIDSSDKVVLKEDTTYWL